MNLHNTDPQPLKPGAESPFKVPERYFEDLNRSILGGVETLPSSADNARPHPFRTPDGYFETLSGKILLQLEQPARIIPIKRTRIHPAWWLSAAAAIVFSLFLFNGTLHTTVIEPATQDAISWQEVQQSYLMDDLDEALIADACSSQAVDVMEDALEIQEYLIENETDFSQIDIEI
ncbi:MAG: hypothetical protein RL021_1020 [Bacteroidota bacterium]|jgi:hypothetical protein